MTTKNNNLTPYNACNAHELQMMASKAVCAYANWKSTEGNRDQLAMEHGREEVEKAIIAHQSEYEATVRCIAMFVRESLTDEEVKLVLGSVHEVIDFDRGIMHPVLLLD